MKSIIIKPKITEKSISLSEVENKYTFEVGENTEKIEIKKFVESKYNVNVLSVNVHVRVGKVKSFGKKRIMGKRTDKKIAIVSLKKGDTINEFNIK